MIFFRFSSVSNSTIFLISWEFSPNCRYKKKGIKRRKKKKKTLVATSQYRNPLPLSLFLKIVKGNQGMVGYGYGMGMGWACMARRGIHVANPSRPELSPQGRILHIFGRVSVKVDIDRRGRGSLSVCACASAREEKHRSGIQASIWECFHALQVILRLTKKLPSSSLLFVFSRFCFLDSAFSFPLHPP